MQSGAFVQLLVVLAGMASRIRMLSVDLDEALRMTSSSLKQFLSLDAVRALATLRLTLTLAKEQPLNLASPAVPDNVLASPVSGETVETEINEPVLRKPTSVVQIIRTCLSFGWAMLITCLSSARIRKGRQIVTEKRTKNIISEGPSGQKKVKSGKPRYEIDDIFSFTK